MDQQKKTKTFESEIIEKCSRVIFEKYRFMLALFQLGRAQSKAHKVCAPAATTAAQTLNSVLFAWIVVGQHT